MLSKIFKKLPIELVNKILNMSYGPISYEIYVLKKNINNIITNHSNDIILNLSEDNYIKTPELYQYNNDIWYDYSIGIRIPKLIA